MNNVPTAPLLPVQIKVEDRSTPVRLGVNISEQPPREIVDRRYVLTTCLWCYKNTESFGTTDTRCLWCVV